MQAAVYSFMQFPSGSVAESAQVNEALLNKLVTVSSGMTSGEVVCSSSVAYCFSNLTFLFFKLTHNVCSGLFFYV